jgi:hypothetical protein
VRRNADNQLQHRGEDGICSQESGGKAAPEISPKIEERTETNINATKTVAQNAVFKPYTKGLQ